MQLFGWKFKNNINVDKALIIGYPHTSWFDSFILWCLSFIINIRGIMKAESIINILIATLCGFIKVNRNGKMNQTDIISDYINNYKGKLYVSIAPEGTRKKRKHIKTGFYYIAKRSDIPIICGILNYKTRTITFSDPIYIDDDINKTIEKIRDYYYNNNINELVRYPEYISPFKKT